MGTGPQEPAIGGTAVAMEVEEEAVVASAAATSAHLYERDELVLYRTREDALVPARVLSVHHETNPPYYTILCDGDGTERQTEGTRLHPTPQAVEVEKEEVVKWEFWSPSDKASDKASESQRAAIMRMIRNSTGRVDDGETIEATTKDLLKTSHVMAAYAPEDHQPLAVCIFGGGCLVELHVRKGLQKQGFGTTCLQWAAAVALTEAPSSAGGMALRSQREAALPLVTLHCLDQSRSFYLARGFRPVGSDLNDGQTVHTLSGAAKEVGIQCCIVGGARPLGPWTRLITLRQPFASAIFEAPSPGAVAFKTVENRSAASRARARARPTAAQHAEPPPD